MRRRVAVGGRYRISPLLRCACRACRGPSSGARPAPVPVFATFSVNVRRRLANDGCRGFLAQRVNGSAVCGVCFDVGLVEGVVGDERRVDFEEVYRRELVAIVALAVALTGNRETGVDLAHEAMLRAFRDWSRVERLERPGGWIRRVVINLALDVRRRGGREQRALRRLDTSEKVDLLPPDDQFWSAVRELPPRQRAVVALRYIEDLPVAEIASLLEVSEGTVKTSLFRARRTLAETLGAEEVRDGDD